MQDHLRTRFTSGLFATLLLGVIAGCGSTPDQDSALSEEAHRRCRTCDDAGTSEASTGAADAGTATDSSTPTDAGTVTDATTTVPDSGTSFDAFQQHNLDVINQYRATKGIAPLVLDLQLSQFALAGSYEEAQDHIAHKHFIDAETSGTLYQSGFYGTAAENQGDPYGVAPQSTDPAQSETSQIDLVLQAMFNEGPGGGHYENMMNASLTRVGIGLYEVSGRLYLTNDFSQTAPPSDGGTSTDTTPPPTPSHLAATAASSSRIDLTWYGVVDSGGSGLAGYYVYRVTGAPKDGSSPFQSYTDTGLLPSTQYCYQVAAYDNAGNVSAPSAQVCATTDAPESATFASLGGYHSCAILADGTARCWGANNAWQLGSMGQDSYAPKKTGLTGVAELAMGYEFSCSRHTDGSIRCWGNNSNGEYGNDLTTINPSPTLTGRTGTDLPHTLGHWHNCGRTGTGASCFGYNNYGQLGIGTVDTNTAHPTPASVLNLSSAAELSLGHFHSCARLTDGTMKCWGYNGQGELGTGTADGLNYPSATSVVNLSGVAHIATGHQFTCALLTDGTVRCWGSNGFGSCGDGTTTAHASPVVVSGLSGVTQIVANGKHACALKSDGTVACWGLNDHGQLGIGTTTNATTPTPVVGLSGVRHIAAGFGHVCAVLTTGGVRCWGRNDRGQLGDGTTIDRTTPVDVRW